MRIAIISRGRTKTTALTNYLKLKYNLENKFEDYFLCHKKTSSIIYQSPWKKKSLDEKIIMWKDSILKFTNQIHLENNFVIKIWPSMFIFPPAHLEELEDLNNFKKRIIFNITNYGKIQNYDKIYFLDRDLYSSVMSWAYSSKTRIYHKFNNSLVSKSMNIILTNQDLSRARFYILEYCLQQKLKNYLIEKNIPFYEDLDWNKINSEYKLSVSPTNLNYKELIDNVKELKELYHNFYPMITDQIKNWRYV